MPSSSASSGPEATYSSRLAAGVLRSDPDQARAVDRLQDLHCRLAAYRPSPPPGGLLGRLSRRSKEKNDAPRGLYLHGGVGRGKSMLMDLFFDTAPVAARRRVHFFEFMLEVHGRLHARRQAHPREPEPLRFVADAIAEGARLLCFDEFNVTNIADAMILGRLFEALFARGVVMVATSNWPPERLYEHGLQRSLFLPFIDLLIARAEPVALDGDTDYRLQRLRDLSVYHAPLGPATDARLEEAFSALTDGAPGEAEELPVGGRKLLVPRAARGVAFIDFAALCDQPLGAADYLALTGAYHTLILSGVPRLTPDKRNEARRFMTLIDALYERRMSLVVGAEASPGELYPSGDGAFEFQRTVSRLLEMQSRDYVASAETRAHHKPTAPFEPFALTSDIS